MRLMHTGQMEKFEFPTFRPEVTSKQRIHLPLLNIVPIYAVQGVGIDRYTPILCKRQWRVCLVTAFVKIHFVELLSTLFSFAVNYCSECACTGNEQQRKPKRKIAVITGLRRLGISRF